MGLSIVSTCITCGGHLHICLVDRHGGRASDGGEIILRHLVIDGIIASVRIGRTGGLVVGAGCRTIFDGGACGSSHGNAMGLPVVEACEACSCDGHRSRAYAEGISSLFRGVSIVVGVADSSLDRSRTVALNRYFTRSAHGGHVGI